MTATSDDSTRDLGDAVPPYHYHSIPAEIWIRIGNKIGEYEQDKQLLASALNALLVWIDERPAALPPPFHKEHVSDLIDFFNEIPQQVGNCQVIGKLDLPIIHHRHRNDKVVKQNLIIREDNWQVCSTAEFPVDDTTMGQLLGMYPRNTLHFASGQLDHAKTAFEIWESWTRTLIYAEVWEENLLSDQEKVEFIMLSKAKVESWNRAMKMLGFVYRFDGVIQMKERDVGWTTVKGKNSILEDPLEIVARSTTASSSY